MGLTHVLAAEAGSTGPSLLTFMSVLAMIGGLATVVPGVTGAVPCAT
ncbi:hypothetical protein ACWT_2953 [Actinoplanes sp. SE50]|nr:hypothetical protein [Actinoplanes sp. SE50]AEV83489.1 hypothetical protein ACPL_2594 [Actinoplanes sp. SE50/110]ATO82368.1 hypothetical protein ACWT_2953 [Actinoplanes sp. SE50]SLL99775.1 hypothetical protein ACSP50_3006 [Actinoplanes sp. SE50/110]